MFHSLDVWHKSNKVTAKVSEVRKFFFLYTIILLLYFKKKGCKSLSEWLYGTIFGTAAGNVLEMLTA